MTVFGGHAYKRKICFGNAPRIYFRLVTLLVNWTTKVNVRETFVPESLLAITKRVRTLPAAPLAMSAATPPSSPLPGTSSSFPPVQWPWPITHTGRGSYLRWKIGERPWWRLRSLRTLLWNSWETGGSRWRPKWAPLVCNNTFVSWLKRTNCFCDALD